MASFQELFKDLNRRHCEATAVNDLQKINELSVEYENLLNQIPGASVVLFGLGTCKLQLGMNGSAIMYFHEALKGLPESAEIWNNLGSAWKAENNNEEARKCFEKALGFREHADYYNNLATLHVNEGNPKPGLEFCEKGLALNPEQPRLHWNYSLLKLESGEWEEGFKHYDYGLLSHDRPMRFYNNDPEKIPMWEGQRRGRVVVYGEQGMGDEIMFASCLPDILIDAEDVVFDCHDRMIGLFERSFPGLKCYPTRKSNAIEWPNDDPIDYKMPIGSLFRMYRSHGNFPKVPYLTPCPERTAKYRKRLEESGDGPYVGIAWKAGGKKTNAHQRSFKLSQFQPFFDVGGTFVSLQYLDEDGKCERFKKNTGTEIHHWPEVIEAGPKGDRLLGFDYDETAALVNALDLCIVPNTTIVHLCGAIGKDCFTLTPNACAWRYQLKGDEMPMYGPWVKQYRERDDWKWAFLLAARDYEAKFK